jgi:flagellar export protein FliJ
MYPFDNSRDFMKVSARTKFSTVLKVKKIQERKSQTELRQLEVAHAREEATLADIKQTQQAALSDAVRSMKIKATDAQTNRAFIKKLSNEIDVQSKKVEKVVSLEQDKRGELIERTKSKSMIEKLDQRVQTEEAKEKDRKEQRLMDVLAQRLRSEKP